MKMKQHFDAVNDACRENSHKGLSPAVKLEKIVMQLFGKECWEDLCNVEVQQRESDDPLEAYLFMRKVMCEHSYFSISGFRNRFYKTSLFDELTYPYREKITAPSLREKKASYTADIEGQYYRFGENEKLGLKPSYFDPRLETYKHNEDAGQYRERKVGSNEYRYYYRNELDHLITHLLLNTCSGKGIKQYRDFGLVIVEHEIFRSELSQSELAIAKAIFEDCFLLFEHRSE